ncbi:hypothetical protein G7Y89_g12601 [Cudoniella acicularis]|uniref:Uncharacterized protein n=1 Tax=Cudoniella acicularis TaxID=354080 RepID=A0A8H4RCA6_9HELO|nr:hypothetical protein G7Y89_g12601 [Cudoniella acicularis]
MATEEEFYQMHGYPPPPPPQPHWDMRYLPPAQAGPAPPAGYATVAYNLTAPHHPYLFPHLPVPSPTPYGYPPAQSHLGQPFHPYGPPMHVMGQPQMKPPLFGPAAPYPQQHLPPPPPLPQYPLTNMPARAPAAQVKWIKQEGSRDEDKPAPSPSPQKKVVGLQIQKEKEHSDPLAFAPTPFSAEELLWEDLLLRAEIEVYEDKTGALERARIGKEFEMRDLQQVGDLGPKFDILCDEVADLRRQMEIEQYEQGGKKLALRLVKELRLGLRNGLSAHGTVGNSPAGYPSPAHGQAHASKNLVDTDASPLPGHDSVNMSRIIWDNVPHVAAIQKYPFQECYPPSRWSTCLYNQFVCRFKTPIRYNNPDATDIASYAAGVKSIEHENVIYEILNERKSKHPNLLRYILAIPEGIFLERLATTLEFRNRGREKEPASESTVIRWTKQLVSAEAYLEELGTFMAIYGLQISCSREKITSSFAISAIPLDLASGFEPQPQDFLQFPT